MGGSRETLGGARVCHLSCPYYGFGCPPPGGPSPGCSRSGGPLQQHSPKRERGWSPYEGSVGSAPVKAQTCRDMTSAVVPRARVGSAGETCLQPRWRQRAHSCLAALPSTPPAPASAPAGCSAGLCPVCAAVRPARGTVSSAGRPSVPPRACRPLLEDVPRLPLVLWTL